MGKGAGNVKGTDKGWGRGGRSRGGEISEEEGREGDKVRGVRGRGQWESEEGKEGGGANKGRGSGKGEGEVEGQVERERERGRAKGRGGSTRDEGARATKESGG